MATNDKKISNLVGRQLPEFIQSQSPALLEFVEKYYTLMESAEITLTNIGAIDQILLETANVSYLQLNATDEFNANANDYIVDESSAKGEFQNGETITGATSGQTATILIEDADNSKLYVTANTKFITGETITGSTSGATATIGKYRGNPIENITQLLDYADVNNTLDDFFIEFKKTFLNSIPDDLASGLDKRNIINRIGELYQKKGTTDGHKAFFRLLLDENSEIYYPTVDMLRVSNGNWKKRKFIKVTVKSPVDADTTRLTNQTITQTNVLTSSYVNTATAVVNEVTKETINGVEVSTLFLEEDSIVGDFRYYDETINLLLEDDDSLLLETGDEIVQETNANQETEIFITGIDNTNPEVSIKCVIRPTIDQIQITESGAYYIPNDTINFTNGGSGTRGSLQIDEVSSSGISAVKVDDGGSGYAVGDLVVVDNGSTGGSGFTAQVNVINGGFILEGETEFRMLDEEGGIVVMESETNSNLNDITDIKVTNEGGGYSTLPALSITSTSGSGADIFAIDTRVGRLLGVSVLDHGYNYQTIPEVNIHTHLQIKDLSDSFIVGETVTSTTTDSLLGERFESITDTIRTEASRPAQYLLEAESGSIQLETTTQDRLDEEEMLLIDDLPREENVRMVNELGTEYTGFLRTENPDNLIILGDNVEEAQQTVFLVDETNGDNILLEDQTTVTAVVEKFNGDDNLIEMVNVTGGEFQLGETIVGLTSGCTATIVNDDTGQLTATINSVSSTSGEYVNVNSHVSESTKKIQDSYYYQDYSYVVKIGESIRVWRDYLKRSIHPSGFQLFGEVSVASQINAKMKTGFTLTSGAVETDEVIELFQLIFSEKIGRRLGTVDDGTSLRSPSNLGIEGSASFGNTRDVTLKREYTLKMNSDRTRSVQSINVTRGFVYAGPRYKTINRLASTAFDTTASDSGITLDVLNNIKIRGTGALPPNENTPTFETFSSDLRTNFTIPTQINRIVYGENSFDEDATTFDSDSNTFDAA